MGNRTRRAIVRALDDLGERDKLSYDQRSRADTPYPPSVVDERLETIRAGRLGYWAVAGISVLEVGAVALGYQFDLELTEFAVGFLPMLVPVLGVAVRGLVYESKAEELYSLLQTLNEEPEPSPERSEMEAAR